MGSNGTHTDNRSMSSTDMYAKTPYGRGVQITMVNVPYDEV